MNKYKAQLGLIFLLMTGWLFFGKANLVKADWWSRPDNRPTQPGFVREEGIPTQSESPTSAPAASPTQQVLQPTVTPRVGGLPSATPAPSSSGSGEDPCASGKSYVGPYCGWSPRVGGEESGSGAGGGGQSEQKAQVLGLSATSSRDLMPSDIILLFGVLCLLLYVRSKLPVRKLV